MLRKNLAAVFVAAAVGATGIYFAPGTASAMPISGGLPDIVKNDTNLVTHKKGKHHKYVKKKVVYEVHRHGRRYRDRREGYVYYNGWWYARPWWQDPGVFICIGC